LTDVKPTTKQTDSTGPMQKAKETVKEVSGKGIKGGTGAMMGAAAGAVAGATLGGLAGAALTDEKTRKTVGDNLSKLARTAGETMKKLDENKGELKRATNTLKDTAQPVTKKS
jgi:outer membrane lipoprotein SlyB